MEEKTFIVYGYALLVLCKGKTIFLVGAEDIDKKRQLDLKNGEDAPCKLVNQTHFLIQEEERVTEMCCPEAEEWVKTINSSL